MKQIYLLTTLYRTKPVSWWQINKMLQTLGRDLPQYYPFHSIKHANPSILTLSSQREKTPNMLKRPSRQPSSPSWQHCGHTLCSGSLIISQQLIHVPSPPQEQAMMGRHMATSTLWVEYCSTQGCNRESHLTCKINYAKTKQNQKTQTQALSTHPHNPQNYRLSSARIF